MPGGWIMERVKGFAITPAGVAGIASFLCGIMTHMYALTNNLHNYDDIFSQPLHYGSGVPSGRFALEWLANLSVLLDSGYDLPWVNGVLFLVLLSLTAELLVTVLSIQRTSHAALVGMLFTVFPTAASILIHRFTAVYYGISILLAVLAVWVLPRRRAGFLFSSVCISLSMGIYQAYVPITISLFVLQLLRKTLEGEEKPSAIVKQGLRACVALLLGVGLYALILKLALHFTGRELLDYQGIDQMGRLSLQEIPGLVKDAVYLVCMLPVKNYCDINGTVYLKAVYCFLGIVSVAMIAYILLVKRPKLGMVILTGTLCIAFLIAVNFIYIMCPHSHIYTLMVYAAALIGCAPVVIIECVPPMRQGRRQLLLSRVVAGGIALLIAGYAYEDNLNYTALYYCNRQVENYMNALVVQVRMTDGFDTDKEWAFVGAIDDPLMWFSWESGLTYGGTAPPENLLNCHSTMAWVNQYFGYAPPLASPERIEELSATEAVRAMPVWPDAGSIQVIEDTVVIKCAG